MLKLIKCEFLKLKRKKFIPLIILAAFLFPIPLTYLMTTPSMMERYTDRADAFDGLFNMVLGYGIQFLLPCIIGVIAAILFFMERDNDTLTFVLVGSFMLAGCSKDEILNHYNNIVQSAGSIELTGKSSLQGEKEKGIDDYTGTYTADYANFSGTEYLFGGTSIKREAGKELSIDCTLEITEGTAKVFWISGSDEAVTLIEATGTYSDTITLPDGGNYIGIECENFTGNIELNIE